MTDRLDDETEQCDACDGTGFVLAEATGRPATPLSENYCPECEGTGRVEP